MRTNRRNTPLARRIAALEAGTAKHIAGKTVVAVIGVTLTAKEIQARLGALKSYCEAMRAARAALARAVNEYHAEIPCLMWFADAYTAALRKQLGADSPELHDFGIGPDQPSRSRRARAALLERARAARGLSRRSTRNSRPRE
jgi:hypothetical protein